MGFLGSGFITRRALHGEDWSLPEYLAHFGRYLLGLAGFWILLMLRLYRLP